jgi:hypothetical protein
MTQKWDFYELVRLYCLRNNSAYIYIDTLIKFLKKNGLRPDAPPELKFWVDGTRGKIFAEIAKLSSDEKCILQSDAAGERIFLPIFFIDKIEELYITLDISTDKPFPSEENLSAKIPKEYVREISVETGVIDYLNTPQNTRFPVLKLIFPEVFGELIVLPSQIPKRILEVSLLKMKKAMQKNRMADFYKQKLMAHFAGQEFRVTTFFNNIMQNHHACINDIEEANDFTFSAWVFLCPLIKTQVKFVIKRNNQIYPENIALYQAATLLLVFVNHYKIIAINKHNKEMAFAAVEEKMTVSPYMYTFNDILNFTAIGGIRILQRYTEEDLKEWLKQKTMMQDNKQPAIFKFTGPDGIDFFMRKDRVFPFCSAAIKDVQPKVKSEIVDHWTKLLREYRKEAAMEKEQYFDEAIKKAVLLYTPQLITILYDKRTFYLWRELAGECKDTSAADKLFDGESPAPLKKVLRLRRDDILLYCKLSLPFWYSIPFIVSLASFFKYRLKKENKQAKSGQQKENVAESALKASAQKLAKEMTPAELTLETYMENTIDRWNQLLNKWDRERLTQDVNKMIKDYIPYALKFFGRRNLNSALLSEIAERIMNSNPNLSKIKNKNHLCLYIKLFLIKTLMN